jgi:hypothetical protein
LINLVEKFFNEDLTGADEEALEKLLLQSPEAASRFNVLAEEAYLATGQLAHQWPGKAIQIPPVGGMGTGLKLFLVLLTLGTAVAIWRFWPQSAPEVFPKTVIPVVPIQPVVAPLKAVANQIVHPGIVPKRASAELEGDALGILVETPQVALVTVRVLDSSGHEIRSLYTGVLDPGKWSFRWDGLLENGKPATGGNYMIEVQKGSHRLSKPVHLLLK